MTLSENFHEALSDYTIALAILCVALITYAIRIEIDKCKDSSPTEDPESRSGHDF